MNTHSDNLARVYAAAELLKSEDTTWDALTEVLEPFPGWVRFLEEHRYRRAGCDNRLYPTPMAMDFTALSPDSRKNLQEFFAPFAILAAPELTASERASELTAAGYNAERFCSDQSEGGAPCIAERARETLEAIKHEQHLLRVPHVPSTHADLPRIPESPLQIVSVPSSTITSLFSRVAGFLRGKRREDP